MRSPASLDARCYHAALFLCPPAFRREFAQEILLVFDEARHEAWLASPHYGLWSFRARMAADLAITIARQWLRTGWPIMAPLALLYPLAASSALATLWRRVPFQMPRGTADSDVLLLELLAAVVLLIVAATIILTLWFTRPLCTAADGSAMLQARGLTRRYGGLLALDHVSFDLHPGEIVGYLGPNGSGKSTTVNLVVGLLDPSAGELSLNGVALADDPVGYKRPIGYVPEEPFLYTHLTAAEYLTLVGRMRGIDDAPLERRASRLLQLFQLHDSRYRTMSAFSKGMRQRVLLAAALLHNPDLLVLDEPFSGLDVNAGLLFRALLGLLAAQGKMVLFSTHRFDMVEKLCSRVVILSAGRLVAEQRVSEMDRAGAGSLEDIFVRVTEQPDYTPVARQILDTIGEA